MSKSKHFAMRLTQQTDAWVEQEARRTHRTKRAIVEALAEEAVRIRRFLGIAFRGAEHDRRARLLGTALDVWEVIEARKGVSTLEELLEKADISERQIRLALAYYHEYPKEIDQAIAANQASEQQLHVPYPTLVTNG